MTTEKTKQSIVESISLLDQMIANETDQRRRYYLREVRETMIKTLDFLNDGIENADAAERARAVLMELIA